jgi:AcrR family transcriptional regulator
MRRRAYDNTFRSELAEQTRLRLLHAVRDLLGNDLQEPLTMSAVAARAGVSEPTAYRHFPSRDALLEAAAAHYSEALGQPPLAEDADDLPAGLLALAHYFGRNAAWMRSALANPHTAEIRATGRRKRVAAMRALLAPRLAHLEERERELVMALVLSIVRLETWDFATRNAGLSDDEAGRAMAWMAQAMLDALERDRRAGRSTLLDEDTIERGRSWGAAPATGITARPTAKDAKPKTRRGR